MTIFFIKNKNFLLKYCNIYFIKFLFFESCFLIHNKFITNNTYNNKNNFMFLDPPYDSVFTDYGYCKFDKEKHETLAKCFKETQIKCLMVIGKTDFISNLYKDYIVEEFDKHGNIVTLADKFYKNFHYNSQF